MSDLANTQRDSQPRLYGFDGLRAVAVCLVVALHAGTPYALYKMPGLVWPTHDAAPSPLVDAVFWWIECFIMPLFFVTSGFFAAQLAVALGNNGFLEHRTKRLFLPFLAGIAFILPFDLYAWALGWVVDGIVPARSLRTLKFNREIDSQVWGTSHLWFLQYLYMYCLAYVGLTTLARKWNWTKSATARAVGSRVNQLLASPAGFLVLVLPAATVIYFAPRVILGFQHSFFPVPSKFIYNAVFFSTGTWLFAQRSSLNHIVSRHWWRLAGAAAAYATALPLMHAHLETELQGSQRIVMSLLIASVIWLMVFGLIGAFLANYTRPRPAVQYVAEASFWIYLVHHPIVGLAQVDLAHVTIPAELKFLAVNAVTIAFGLLTYDACVRYTWIGAWLNGRRRERNAAQPIAVPLPATAAKRDAA